MIHRVAVRGRWYWFRLGRSGFIEFGHRRIVWWLFTVPHEPPEATHDAVPAATMKEGGR